MFLEKVSLRQFRNYDQVHVDILSPISFFIGENGSGKTSLLEAIYCALRGQSFYPFIQSQFIKKGEKESRVTLSVREKEGQSELQSFFFLKENNSLQKEYFYCGKKVRSSFFVKKYPCFVFTESSLKCLRQGPNERRDFIENLFYKEEPLGIKKEFYQVLAQKRQLLKNYKKELIKEKDFLSLFKVLNRKFLEKSKQMVQARVNLLNEIFKFLEHIGDSFFGNKPCLDICYKIKENYTHQINKNSIEQKNSMESFLLAVELDLKEKEPLEINLGIPLSGPQKHELIFLFNGEDTRSFCSKGQQRAYMLSLLLSHLKSLPQAFLFLDDVLLELDEGVQEKFLQLLEKNHCQTFLTSCNMVPFKVKKSRFFYITKGQIIKRQP